MTTTQVEPEIVLYDLACTKNVCFSPVVWRIRLILNYKQIPYKTIFLEFPDIEPTLKKLGIKPHDAASGSNQSYTVPAIHHIATDTYVMDSARVAEFLETKYPEPSVPLTSELGEKVERESRAVAGKAIFASTAARETTVVSPRAGEYFRRTREPILGHKLEELIEGDKEDQLWETFGESVQCLNELMQTNKAEGPFILGARPSYTDFFIAGAMQNVRVVHEASFDKLNAVSGYHQIYEACSPYLEKKD